MTEFRPGRFSILPLVVKNLIIINVIMVLAQFVIYKTFGYNLADVLGLHYFRSHLFRPWQLITHMFMHGAANDLDATLLHIFSNMFALWMFGSILENLWGPKRFLTFYLICGIGASLCHMGVLALQYEPIITAYNNYQQNPTLDHFIRFWEHHNRPGAASSTMLNLQDLLDKWSQEPGSTRYANLSKSYMYDYVYGYDPRGAHPADVARLPFLHPSAHVDGILDEATVGASGAVFGVLFAFGFLFPNTLLYFYFLFPIKAKWAVAGYAVFELYSGIRNSAGDNVAHFAHLGGMVVAFVLLKIWNRRYRDRFF